MYRIVYNDELYHYGTKGMHWYERKYQYDDGSLTPAGRERYLKGFREKVKKALPGAIGGDIGAVSGFAVSKAVSKPIAKMITAKYFYDATPENAKIIEKGIESMFAIPVTVAGMSIGAKKGKEWYEKHYGNK